MKCQEREKTRRDQTASAADCAQHHRDAPLSSGRRLRLSTAVVTCSVIVVLAAWHTSRTIDAAGTRQEIALTPSPKVVSIPSKATPAAKRARTPLTWKDFWYGKPAPAPGNFVRETEDYRKWRLRFRKALRILEKRGHSRTTGALRQWLHQFEAREVGCTQDNLRSTTGHPDNLRSGRAPSRSTSALFSLRPVRWVIGPPPLPAFEKFHGYKVVLPWNMAVYYYEANSIPPGTPYLLHPDGVKDGGVPVRCRSNIHRLFKLAGVIDTVARNVLIKVSGCEGGFEAVNTWDTGYVSVGFIQFTTGETSEGHSLVRVLERMKASEDRILHKKLWRTNEFDHYFRRRGVDVRSGRLCIIDPSTRRELAGADAVDAVIKDKRLTALFQDAGAKSRAFQLAQIREAYRSYYVVRNRFKIPAAVISVYDLSQTSEPAQSEAPTPQPIKKHYIYGSEAVHADLAECITEQQFRCGDRTSTDGQYCRVITKLPDLTATYGEILRTEVGKVTLIDRAVQHGVQNAADTFEACVCRLSGGKPLTIKGLRMRESELVAGLRNAEST